MEDWRADGACNVLQRRVRGEKPWGRWISTAVHPAFPLARFALGDVEPVTVVRTGLHQSQVPTAATVVNVDCMSVDNFIFVSSYRLITTTVVSCRIS